MNTEHCSLTHRAVGGKLRCICSRTGDNMMEHHVIQEEHTYTLQELYTLKSTQSV